MEISFPVPGSHRAVGVLPFLSSEVLAVTKGRLLSLWRSTLSQELGINTLILLQKLFSLPLGTRLTHTVYINEEIRLWDLFTVTLVTRNQDKNN